MRILKLISCLLLLMMMVSLATEVGAVAPAPGAVQRWMDKGIIGEKLAVYQALRQQGMGQPATYPVISRSNMQSLATADDIDTIRVVVLLVDFNDHAYNGDTYGQHVACEPGMFDSVLFSTGLYNPSGSMTEYYFENSYGNLFILGDVYGWYRMPSPYTYYVGSDGGASGSREMAADALAAADAAGVDFSPYDYDDNGLCDGLIVLHAGRGAEEYEYGIWSHMSHLSTSVQYDNVYFYDYVIGAEEYVNDLSPIGVITHEYGHIMGLPDLYDTDDTSNTSEGLGRWSIMASGNYNSSAKSPAHFDSWCKIELGFITPIDVVAPFNLHQVEIPDIENNPVVYRLHNPDVSSSEYWLVENRQRVHFDWALPGDGLCIYHVDNAVPNNDNAARYKVAMEQADGLNNLAVTTSNGGDYGDVWPGFTENHHFHTYSLPNSLTNLGQESEIGVWNISESGPIMYADLDVTYSRPWVDLDEANPPMFIDRKNGETNGLIEPGDTVSLYFWAHNFMRPTFNARASVFTDNTELDFVDNRGNMAQYFDDALHTNYSGDPVVFIMPDSIIPTVDSFFVVIESDSMMFNNDRVYADTFAFTLQLGTPGILLVDDDRGMDYELTYSDALNRLSMPHDIFETSGSNIPTAEDLQGYSIVIWFTGDTAAGAINAADMDAMQLYLESGGSVLLSSASALYDVGEIDPTGAFMQDYFHASWDGSYSLHPFVYGEPSNTNWDGLNMSFRSGTPYFPVYLRPCTAMDPGEEAFVMGTYPDENVGYCGVSYSGSFKTLFTSFPLEYMKYDNVVYDPIDSVLSRAIDFFGIGFVTGTMQEPITKSLPQEFNLNQNYPNPFNPTTTISYSINTVASTGKQFNANLTVFNVLGQQVRVLVDEPQGPGNYTVNWDGTNSSGTKVSSGIYFYRLLLGEESQTRKMVLLK